MFLMSRFRLCLLLLSVSSVSIACGDDDGDSAPAQCERLARELCDKGAACLGNDFGECFDDFVNSPPPCSEADRTSASFDQCISDINAASCADVIAAPDQLPPSCNGAVIFD